MGYGGTTTRDGGRADLVSLEYGLRALKEAGLPADDAVWRKAIKFLERAQNNSETNDQDGRATTVVSCITRVSASARWASSTRTAASATPDFSATPTRT
jgi:hypothetical protein